MKVKIGMVALAAAGVGFLLCTDKGRALMRQANGRLMDGYQLLSDRFNQEPDVETTISKALEQPHPDTAVAHAFEKALT